MYYVKCIVYVLCSMLSQCFHLFQGYVDDSVPTYRGSGIPRDAYEKAMEEIASTEAYRQFQPNLGNVDTKIDVGQTTF